MADDKETTMAMTNKNLKAFKTISKLRPTLKYEIRKQFSCCVCGSLPRPTIKLITCPSDHIICHLCQESLTNTRCPMCRSLISGPIKNHHVSNLLTISQKHTTFNCLNDGCNEKLTYDQRSGQMGK